MTFGDRYPANVFSISGLRIHARHDPTKTSPCLPYYAPSRATIAYHHASARQPDAAYLNTYRNRRALRSQLRHPFNMACANFSNDCAALDLHRHTIAVMTSTLRASLWRRNGVLHQAPMLSVRPVPACCRRWEGTRLVRSPAMISPAPRAYHQ